MQLQSCSSTQDLNSSALHRGSLCSKTASSWISQVNLGNLPYSLAWDSRIQPDIFTELRMGSYVCPTPSFPCCFPSLIV